jgi:EmrB/QacA subfamily drug resistance transporter
MTTEPAPARTAPERRRDTPSPRLLWPTATVLAGAVMNSLSMSAINVALPALTDLFHTTPAAIAWVSIGQSLATATLLTVFGRLSDMTGRKRMYLSGLIIAMTASALSGLSGSVGQIVFFRIIHGIGSAMVLANSVAYLVEIHPASRRGLLVGAWEAGIAIGLAVGPTAGGLILATLGWHAIFFIYTIVSLILLPPVVLLMVEPKKERRKQRFDFLGAALFAGALTPVMVALTLGQRGGLLGPLSLLCLAVSVLSLVAFIAVERRVKEPMVHLELFQIRGFSAGNLAKVCAYFGFSANNFLLPFYWARVLGLPPAEMGLTLTGFPLGMLVGSLISGPLSDRIGTRLLAPAGLFIITAASLVQTQVSAPMGLGPVVVAAVLAGLGAGVFIAPNDSAILAVTPKTHLGVASGIMGVSRTIGTLLGQSVTAGLLTARLAARGDDFVPSYHEVFAVVALVTFLGVGLAAVRDRPEGETGADA